MKKLVLIVLLLFPMIHVRAEISYTPYSDWREVEVLPNLENDLLEVRKEKQYQWYRLKKEGKYFKVGDEHKDYPVETEIFKYGEWSNWSNEKPVEVESLELETRKIYHYRTMRKIQFIRLSEIETKDLEITNIHIYNGKEEISFEMQKENSMIVFELEKPCYADQLEISFTMVETTNDEKHFKIEWLYDFDTVQNFETYCRFWFSGTYDVTYRSDNMAKKLIAWSEEEKSFDKIESDDYKMVWTEEQYRYREQFTYYEKEVREYNDSYSAFPLEEFPYPDLKTEKIVFQIRTREKKEVIEPKTEKVVKENFQPAPILLTDSGQEKDNSESLEKELQAANLTIASLKNEKSKEEVKPCTIISNKKSSHLKCIMLSLLLFLLGVLIGRILTSEKKF